MQRVSLASSGKLLLSRGNEGTIFNAINSCVNFNTTTTTNNNNNNDNNNNNNNN